MNADNITIFKRQSAVMPGVLLVLSLLPIPAILATREKNPQPTYQIG